MPECPIVGAYDVQRFVQFSPEDCANWTLTTAPSGKKKNAMFPTLGRHHFTFLGQDKLQFESEARDIFRSINFMYIVVGNSIFQIDKLYNVVQISGGQVTTLSGSMFFTFIVSGFITFAVFVDGEHIYVYQEPYTDGANVFHPGTFYTVSDPNAPQHPTYVATFGDRIVVSERNSSQFNLSVVLLGGATFEPATCFTVAGLAVFAQESGIIRQFAVLNNTLYIMTDYTTGVWSNIPTQLIPAFASSAVTFPWKKSSSDNWDFGIADPDSLDIDFHRIAFLAQNQNGLVQIMISNGGLPERISTKAIDILFQRDQNTGNLSPFLLGHADGFLYQYENVIYYRLSAGLNDESGILDQETKNNSIEYNFDTKTWSRCIEVNGQRCLIQKHAFFDNHHFVTVQDEGTVYEFSGQFYSNEIESPPDPDGGDVTYIEVPFRYERVTPLISQENYSEFITDYVQIDFVWGEDTFISWPFLDPENPDGGITYLESVFRPQIELYFSDDGGISFSTADIREFSQLGVYKWRMRWYQLGPSRDRCYKLVCVSTAPIVVLGATMEIRLASGGAN